MSIAAYFEMKTEDLKREREERRRRLEEEEKKAIARVHAEWDAWLARRAAAESWGKPFNEPYPSRPRAIAPVPKVTWLDRLKRRRIWPHIMAVGVICGVAGLIALGVGVVWLLNYIAGLIGGVTLFLVIVVPPALYFTYRGLVGFFRFWYGTDECRDGTDAR